MGRATDRQIRQTIHPFLKKLTFQQVWRMYRTFRNERPQTVNGRLWLNSFFPPYPSEAFDRFVAITLEKQRAPYQIYFAVTSDCPYHCAHCSYGRRKPSNLPTDILLNIIQQLKDEGTAILGFTGGEPLLRDDLEDLVAAAGPEMTTVIFTTGFSLDEKRAQRFADAGVGCITIGLESAEEHTHDAIRGTHGSFTTGLAALTACKHADIYTSIGTMASHERLYQRELQRLYDLGCEYYVDELRILSPVPTGALTGTPSVLLSPQEKEDIKRFHIRSNKRNTGPVVAANAYLESAEMFGCNAGYHHCFIDASGEVCPCDLMPLSFGNLTEHSFHEVWNAMEPFFPRPQANCLMGRLAGKIPVTTLPLPPAQSSNLLSDIEPSALPRLYQHLLPRQRSK